MAAVGDVWHVLTILSNLSFAYITTTQIMMQNNENTPRSNDHTLVTLDPSWKEYGFCVSNIEEPYWNSHDMCCYVDTVLAILFALLYYGTRIRHTPGMESSNALVQDQFIGILMHGMGHEFIAYQMRNNNFTNTNNNQFLVRGIEKFREHESIPMGVLQYVLPIWIFWFCLLPPVFKKMNQEHETSGLVALAATLTTLLHLFVPSVLAFTYVQTVLMVCFSITQLLGQGSRGTKNNMAYATYPIVIGFPLTLIGWMEATRCTAFVRDRFYGHVAYDAYIPLSGMTWYLLMYCWIMLETRRNQKEKKA